MNVVIFGSGPMSSEPEFAVTAPGSRTWQIVRTVASGLSEFSGQASQITVLGLESVARPDGNTTTRFNISAGNGQPIQVIYYALSYEEFQALSRGKSVAGVDIPADASCVVACASAQPYSTGAIYARRHKLPLWVDVFGDPICETQSQAELQASEAESNGKQFVHVWKLLLDGLMQGDRFSGLSHRQRFALLGQLGAAGRLNQFTAREDLVEAIPYAVFSDEVATLPPPASHGIGSTFTVMWCGSFNTWMDVGALLAGVTDALKKDTRLRLLVVGGRIAGYNESSYDQFVRGVQVAGLEGLVRLMDWQPLQNMSALYAQCDAGLCIDRFTYEAMLGSRTRIVNFLAAGKPVISTVITELAEELAAKGYVIPFELGAGADLTRALLESVQRSAEFADLGSKGRQYILSRFDGNSCGLGLREWIKAPSFSLDKTLESEKLGQHKGNPLWNFWSRSREPLGA